MRPPVGAIDDVAVDGGVVALVATDTRIGRVSDGAASDGHVCDSVELDTLSGVERPGVSYACGEFRRPVALVCPGV